ncbi:MAG: hypothetical protein GF346_12595 [Candidatus Eisenbacteria bacterium]|nr:hypothetical protein [Candidatus Latescibacterota bacterium]MBD3303275.1 hypothetical protein [Candidatus Eisenbacteria bacterium]
MNVEKLTRIDRRIIFLVMAAVIAIPMLVAFDLPMTEQKPTLSLFRTIEEIDPEEQVLLVSTDYSPHTEAENQPMTIAVLRHAFAKGVRVLIVSLYIESAGLAADAMDRTMEEFNREATSPADSIVYGRDVAFLGWQPPPIVPILSMGESIAGIYPVDFYGNKTDSLAVMRGVQNYDDVGIVVALSGGEGPKWYVQFAQTKFGVKVGAGVTAVNTPDFYPYFETGQFSGMMGGMKGAAEYEALVERTYGREGRKRATEGMGSQSAAHMMIIVFVLLGNVAYFAGRRRERR